MERIAKFLEHARDCMELAARTSGEQHDSLLRIAEAWTGLAAERRQLLEDGQTPAPLSGAAMQAQPHDKSLPH